MVAKAFLYDADGHDREVPIDEVSLNDGGERRLLWIDCDQCSRDEVLAIIQPLGFADSCLSSEEGAGRFSLDNYGDHFHFRIHAPPQHSNGDAHEPEAQGNAQGEEPTRRDSQQAATIDFIVGKNVLVTIHDAPVEALARFREQDKSETVIGLLSPQALTASLLDWHLATFFEEVSRIEAATDKLDERVLRETASKSLLGRMVAMRRRVSKLRSLLVGQRDIFYGLSRPDFALVTDAGAAGYYQALSNRFDRALDEVERARDLITGSFDLFTSRSSQLTNDLVKILTFVTAIIGFCAAIAGLLGMNFQLSIFNTGYRGFLVVTAGLFLCSALSMLYARRKGWI